MNIVDRLDTFLLESSKRERKTHYPSDVTACVRQLAYKWNGYDETDPPTAGNIIKMRFGNLAEDILEDWLKWELANGTIESYDKESEVWGGDPDLEYPIHGYIDFVIHGQKGKYGIECKSSFGRGVKDVQMNGPKPEHVMQVYMYMRFTDIKHFFLVYLGRDNGYRTQFELTMDDAGDMYVGNAKQNVDWKSIIGRLRIAEQSVGDEILPDREFKAAVRDGEIVDKFVRQKQEYKSDWQCRYCNYRRECWQDQIKGGVWYGETEIV